MKTVYIVDFGIMEITAMEEDETRKRLKKKVLDRWENEGGKLGDDLTKTPESGRPRKRAKNLPKHAPGISAAGNNKKLSAQKAKPIKK